MIGIITAVLTVAQAWVLSRAITAVFDAAPGFEYLTHTPGSGQWPDLVWPVALLAAIFGGKALLAWTNTLLAQRAAASVKSQLRRDVVAARLARPLDERASTAGLVTLVTVGLDALDGFYAKYLPQLLLAVTVPVIVGGAILTADVTSAIIVALTVPLIPVFMALVGWATEARTQKRWAMQQRLARHFADLVTGLPTLQVFGRARAQSIGLRKTEDAHRRQTTDTLRISFLSALVLELLATLSVAVVAVTVGFRVVHHDLDLATALFVLILAPEVYLPVRQVGVHYHDAADGMAAADEAFALIDAAGTSGGGLGVALVAVASRSHGAAGSSVFSRSAVGPPHGNEGLRSAPARDPQPTSSPDADQPSASGGGGEGVRGRGILRQESTVSEVAGSSVTGALVTSPTIAEGGDAQAGRFPGRSPSPGSSSHSAGPLVRVAGVGHVYPGGTRPAVSGVSFEVGGGEFVALTGPSGGGKTTVLNALIGFLVPTSGAVTVPPRGAIAYVGQNPGMIAGTIADNVRLGDPSASDAAVAEALARAGASGMDASRSVGDDGEGLSAGERRRVATARALVRIDAGAQLLLLDEPTAGLDADAEATLLRSLRATGVAAVVVSHRPAVLAEADRIVTIGGAP
ncbi:MAG: ATP-binding cassette domain-containing protein [Propioniciclava sp.]|uniref:ABC transporter ATP-binding protein/permease n=1 Tax=Propioniciclava sp. TaxID=2038686 RepID=UPI0039E2848F